MQSGVPLNRRAHLHKIKLMIKILFMHIIFYSKFLIVLIHLVEYMYIPVCIYYIYSLPW